MTVAAHPRANPCAQTCSQSTPISMRQFPGSKSLLSCLGADVIPGIAFPQPRGFIVGPLGLGSPRVRTMCLAAHRPAVLCVATTAFVHPGRFAIRSLPVPWVDALCFVSLPTCAGVGSSAVRIDPLTPGCWLSRSPLLRLWLPRRREALPSSRVTPLNPCPALRPRWCPADSPCRRQDFRLPVTGHGRLWVRLPGLILSSTIIHFSEFNDAAWFLLPLCFGHRLSAVALRFGYRPGG